MYEKELSLAVECVKTAGNIIKDNYDKHTHTETKENWQELVTAVDIEVDNLIVSRIKSNFPGHNIFSEESLPVNKDSDFSWYIDPLDGTTNFVTSVPFLCTAVGLMKGNKAILGGVYNPITDELFTACNGAYLNGKRIHCSKNSDIQKTLINFCHKNNPQDIERISKAWLELKQIGRDLRRLGSGNLDIAYVACGRNDAYFSSSKIFDIAPSLVIAREAGCKITDWHGREWTEKSEGVVITNGTKIHEDLIRILSKL